MPRILITLAILLLMALGVVWFLWGRSSLPSLAPEAASDSAMGETYRDNTFGFLFQYPTGYRVATTTFGDGGELITVEKDANTGFQIAVTPFDESGPLTVERIRLDLPDMVMEEPRAFQVGGDAGAEGVAFFGENAELGKTREIWFSHAGFLYQVTAYARMDKEIANIMGSWRFY